MVIKADIPSDTNALSLQDVYIEVVQGFMSSISVLCVRYSSTVSFINVWTVDISSFSPTALTVPQCSVLYQTKLQCRTFRLNAFLNQTSLKISYSNYCQHSPLYLVYSRRQRQPEELRCFLNFPSYQEVIGPSEDNMHEAQPSVKMLVLARKMEETKWERKIEK